MELQIYNLHWLPHIPEQHDLCAHGAVRVRIGEELLETGDQADYCVSVGALYLLRTLERDHMPAAPIGDQLIPHCGHTMYVLAGQREIEIHHCAEGLDWEVQHHGQQVLLRTPAGAEEWIAADVWRRAVHQCADAVAAFYQRSLPKEPLYEHEQEPFAIFQQEWSRRRG